MGGIRPIKMIVASGHTAACRQVCARFSGERSLEIIGEATTADHSFHLVRSVTPDIAIIDTLIEGDAAIKMARKLKSLNNGPKVILLTDSTSNPPSPEKAIDAGIMGYLDAGVSE